jgi:hypothetical protein
VRSVEPAAPGGPLVVVVPWRPQPSRLPAFAAVTAWYRREFGDGVEIRTVDAGGAEFNIARSRNQGLAAIDDPSRVVVVNDADTLPERPALERAIRAARTSGLVHLPYTEYRWLGEAGSAEHLAGTDADACAHEVVDGACSGVYVTTPATWADHGGQDERFRGWGFEDAAWFVAHETLLGEPPRRHPGRVYALFHEQEARSGPRFEANAALMARYRSAGDDPVALRRLVLAPSAE